MMASREFLVSPEELEGIKNGSFFSGSSDSGSEYFSPGESEVGSTKSSEEEEDDDYIAELSRRMAQYMFQDEEKQEKSWSLQESPQSEKMSAPATPMIEDKEIPIPSITKNPNVELQSKQSLIDEQIRAVQFYKFELKREQSVKPIDIKQRMKQKRRNPSHAWNTLQQQSNFLNGSDIKPALPNKSSTKTASGGTGVFLPRRTGTPSETRKKQGCSTVLIPARVVHALKLHFEKTGIPSRFPLQHDGHVVERDNKSSQQKRHPPTAPAISHHHDLGLPQEWTY